MIRVVGAITITVLSADGGLSASQALFHLFSSPQSWGMDTVISVLHMEKLKIERSRDEPRVYNSGWMCQNSQPSLSNSKDQ